MTFSEKSDGTPSRKFDEFIRIAEELNNIDIIPLLMGSVGMEVVTKRCWDARDIDIHVPGDRRGFQVPPELAVYKWDRIMSIMISMGYELTDLSEHAFHKDGISVEFGISDTLPGFAGVSLEELELFQTGKAEYFLPNTHQYLQVY
ncbi:MAG TPA: hypothetical protein VK861_08395, partial [Bacteroidales bacterium]|nr:hypothetical protein [Bacteroidales bacterium]